MVTKKSNVPTTKVSLKKFTSNISWGTSFTAQEELLTNKAGGIRSCLPKTGGIRSCLLNFITTKLDGGVCLMTSITGGQRAQTSHGIIVSEIQILDKKVYILIISVMEQTKAKKHMKPLSFMAYDKKPKLCAIRQLTKYLKKTPQDFRKTDNLF